MTDGTSDPPPPGGPPEQSSPAASHPQPPLTDSQRLARTSGAEAEPSPQPPPELEPSAPPTKLGLVRALLHTRSLIGRYTRHVRWLPPLVLGLVLGAVLFGSAQCVVERRVGTVEAPSPEPGKPFDITLVITNAYLERQITASLDRSTVFGADRIENIQVRTRNNRVVVTGVIAVVLRPRFEMQLSISVQEGSIRLKVEETRGPLAGQAGNLPRLIEPVINDRVDRATSGFQAELVSATAPDEGVTVTATLRQQVPPTPGPAATTQPCTCITATPTPAR